MNMNARQPNETLDQYHTRLRIRAYHEKHWKMGILVWDSSKRGTYIKRKHGELK